MSDENTTPPAVNPVIPPPDPNFKAYIDALAMTRDAVLLLDRRLPLETDFAVRNQLEAQLLKLERERVMLKDRYRAYEQNPNRFTAPDPATVTRISTLSVQVDEVNAVQLQDQALLNVINDVLGVVISLFPSK